MVEEVDAVPVLSSASRTDLVAPRSVLPVIAQAAAVAATGFAAGAVTAAVVRAARSKRTVRPRRRPRSNRSPGGRHALVPHRRARARTARLTRGCRPQPGRGADVERRGPSRALPALAVAPAGRRRWTVSSAAAARASSSARCTSARSAGRPADRAAVDRPRGHRRPRARPRRGADRDRPRRARPSASTSTSSRSTRDSSDDPLIGASVRRRPSLRPARRRSRWRPCSGRSPSSSSSTAGPWRSSARSSGATVAGSRRGTGRRRSWICRRPRRSPVWRRRGSPPVTCRRGGR